VRVDWDLCLGVVFKAIPRGTGTCTVRLLDCAEGGPRLSLACACASEAHGLASRVQSKLVLDKVFEQLQCEPAGNAWHVPVELVFVTSAIALGATEATTSSSSNGNAYPRRGNGLGRTALAVVDSAEDDTPATGLAMAVLDDNALSRRFMGTFCAKEMRCRACLVRGETKDDVDVFIDEVARGDFDMVLLDQHLDWDGALDDEILGSDVAARLRQRGYNGAVVLNTASSTADVGLGAVDGVLVKSLGSAAEKRAVLTEAWRHARRRVHSR